MSSTQAKSKKKVKPIFCRVCKKYFPISEKEFRDAGHYHNDEKSHLLEPDVGRSSKRHSKALRAETDRLIRKAEARKKKEADDGIINADLDPV